MYVKISTCKKFEFYLYKNKVIKIHIMYVNFALNIKMIGCIASVWGYCMIRVLHLHFSYAIPLGQDKTYSINLIFKLDTPITILLRLWSFLGPCNTLTSKLNFNTPMMVLHNPNKNRVNQIKILQLN
jgi:hypothetical protein